VIVFGLILVLLALAAGVVLFLATQSLTTPVDLELAGYNWGMTPLALLITGAVAMLLFWFGLGIIRGSAKRRRRPIREAKDADRQAKLEESIRADERARAEETHQSALVERDRVRDEEFQTRLADRDRERDGELTSREEEFAAREQAAEQRARENEERVRADERRKVEQEFATRTAGVGAGTAAGAGTDDPTAGRHSSDAETDSVAADRTNEHASDEPDGAPTATGTGTDSVHATDSAHLPDSTGAAGSTESSAGEDRSADDDSSSQGHRTVADKIMGRDPADRA
jgi:hypothetical protein